MWFRAQRRICANSSGGISNRLAIDTQAVGAYFARQPGVVVAYLFGSVAHGQADRLSDVDIAVLLDERLGTDEPPNSPLVAHWEREIRTWEERARRLEDRLAHRTHRGSRQRR